MGTDKKVKATAFLVSAALTNLMLGILIILHENNAATMTLFRSLTGHHWVTTSVFAAVLFPALAALFYFMFRYEKPKRLLKAENLWAWTLILVFVTALMFLVNLINFAFHYFVA